LRFSQMKSYIARGLARSPSGERYEALAPSL
jgi:hypothetical protein